jgi:hypothetical protein
MGQASDVVHARIVAFNAQDVDEIRALLDPDVEWAAPGGLYARRHVADAW